jgi:hypothetical protein
MLKDTNICSYEGRNKQAISGIIQEELRDLCRPANIGCIMKYGRLGWVPYLSMVRGTTNVHRIFLGCRLENGAGIA